jgi:subtilase family serine protease
VITLPNNLVVGNKFHVGAIVDENNKIAEVDESNNATYLGIKVIEFIP